MAKETKTEIIRKLLLKGKTLSNLSALNYGGTFRLADIVYNLRKRGYQIEMQRKLDAFGNTYGEYKMTKTPSGRDLL